MKWLGILAIVGSSGAAYADAYKVSPDVGNSTLTAVFDAKVGERITALSSQVACDVTVDPKALTVTGSCAVPLTSIMVDNEPTKTEHFQQWSTNKKGEPKDCKYEAKFAGVKLDSAPKEGTPSAFTAQIPFTVCGRARTDGGKEKVTGTVMTVPGAKTLKVRAHVDGFNREKYQVGPKWTDGWLSRVQQLAPVVAAEGTLDLNLFAKDASASKP
jgi:hypothetical protein